MNPGIAKVGQRVRTLVEFRDYPDLEVGTLGTIQQVMTQLPGAETDALLVHPDRWRDDLCFPCEARDVGVVE